MSETVSLEVAIEVVLRNGPNFETIAGLCKMAVEAEREACAKVCEDIFNDPQGNNGDDYYYTRPYLECAAAIRRRSEIDSIVQNERSARGQA